MVDGNENKVTRRTILSVLGSLTSVAGGVSTCNVVGTDQSTDTQFRIGLPLEQLWEFGFAGDEGISSPDASVGTITDDTIYIALAETNRSPAKLVALDRATHDRRWELTAENDISTPVVVHETLVTALDGVLKSYQTGSEPSAPVWEDKLGYDFVYSLTPGSDGVIVTADSYVSTGEETAHLEDGLIAKYGTDGTQIWAYRTGYVGGSNVRDGKVYVVEGAQDFVDNKFEVQSGRLIALDEQSGDRLWTTPDLQLKSLRFPWEDDTLLGQTPDGRLYGIDPESGTNQWELSFSSPIVDSTADSEHVYVGNQALIQAVSPSSENTVWERSDLGNPYDLMASGTMLYVGTTDGQFYALDGATGETIWSHSLHGDDGYCRIRDGILYTIAGNWMAAHAGQRGLALRQLQHLEHSDTLDSLSHPIANLVGRKAALRSAESAIDDWDYDDAMAALGRVKMIESGVELGIASLTGGTAYTGLRRGAQHYRHENLVESKAAYDAHYPIDSGALTGIGDPGFDHQAGIALDSLEESWFGPPLRSALRGDDQYAKFSATLDRLLDLHGDLAEVSERLSDLDDHIDTDSWRTAFENGFSEGDSERIRTLLRECEKAIDLTEEFSDIQDQYDEFPLEEVNEYLALIQAPDEDPPEGAIEFCHRAATALTAYTTASETLSQYDLSVITDTLTQSLTPEPDHINPAAATLSDLETLLTEAATAETKRHELNLHHSDLDQYTIEQWIQAVLHEVSLDQIQEISDAIENLQAGIWRPEHLHDYSPIEFEHLVADLYAELGYQTDVSQQSNDRGIDIIARGSDDILGIQVKQYSSGNKVGRPTVQQTAGARAQVNATKAVIVTSSNFTRTATEASREYGDIIELVDGAELCRRLSRSSLTPSVGAGASERRRRSRHRQRRQTTGQRTSQNTSQYGSGDTFCMICGQQFQADLEEVQTPDGETVRCCARCKQLIEEETDIGHTDQSEARDILGVGPDASEDEIRTAYRERAREVHPDQGGSSEKFQRVKDAYDTLLGA